MQGQQSAIGSLPEVIGFDHGSTSSDAGFDEQMCWTSTGNSAQSRLPDYLLSSSDTNMGHQRQDFCRWNFGESSSRAGQDAAGGENDEKSEHDWSAPMNVCTGNSMFSPDQQYLSSNGEDENDTPLVHNSESQLLPQDLNMNIEVDDDDDDEDDDCQILEYPYVFKSDQSRIEQMPFVSSSSYPFGPPSGSGGFLVEQTDGRPDCSSDGRRLSCKRKTLERNARQASEGGSTSNVPQSENSLWLTLTAGQNAYSSTTLAVPEENGLSFNLPEQVNPRLGFSFGQVSSDNSLFLDASGTRGSSRRNFRLRINTAYQPGSVPNSMFSPDTNTGNSNVHSSHHSLRLLPPSNLLDLSSGSAAAGGSTEGQSVALNVSSLHTSSQSRWSGSASLRNVTSTGSFGSGAGNSAHHEASSSSRVPRIIADYPMFVPPSESRSSLHNAPNWDLAGRNVDVSGNVASTSRGSSGAGIHSASPSWVPHRSPSQYPVRLRLAEYVSRSLSTNPDSGGQNGICLHPGSSSSQEIHPSSGSVIQVRHSHSRSAMLLERRIDGSFGIPYSMRTLAAASEGRSRLVSEMRNVLDLVRRGEGLRFEDVMMLDQSVFFGMADIHDRHRDMRLDVDNMSYEELLALEERIGNVSTGLCEESILKQLKQQNYVGGEAREEEIEPCSICQEAYSDGEVLGLLECGHDFHSECIKRWLMNKNLCPICKTTGLST